MRGRGVDATTPRVDPRIHLRSFAMMDCRVKPGNHQGGKRMHILITGAAGMIGRKLTERLVRDGALNGQAIDKLTLTDIVAPVKPAFADRADVSADDIAAPDVAAKLIAGRPEIV